MDHAEAHERIADLAIEPGRLTALAASNVPEEEALLAHISGCPDCTAEIASWRETHDALTAALRRPAGPQGLEPDGPASVEPIRAPAGLRDGMLAAVRGAGIAVPEHVAVVRPPRRLLRPALLGMVAVLALVIAGAGYRLQDERLQAARAEEAALGTVTAALDRVLASDTFEVVPLRRPDGTAAGSISWSRQDIVVLTAALEPPMAGQEYRCWLENEGQRTPIGRMEYAGDVAFWAASLDEWATISIGPETRFGVSLEAVAGSGGSPAVLDAALGS
ncbi:MAG TPA: anti-sigma factor [Candidatus Eisenbacteria bacterium]|nr:anti-sigma factor [Candidatus Eisenbacteria bacterium]